MQIVSTSWLPCVGPDTRPEYLRLPRDLEALTRSFGITLPWRAQRDAAVLTFSIECADRLLDALPEPAGRRQFGANIVCRLRSGGGPVTDSLTPELAGLLAQLGELARRRGAEDKLTEIIEKLLHNCETMRITQRRAEFAECIVREGHLMVEALLLLIGEWT